LSKMPMAIHPRSSKRGILAFSRKVRMGDTVSVKGDHLAEP
jgi:hypothetical protein